MNLYVDARALQKPRWRGEQRYVFHLLDAMTSISQEHAFHLHFGWDGWDPRIDALLGKPNTRRHDHRGRLRSHASLPFAIARSRSRVYFRMYNEDAPMRVPVPCPVAVLVHDNGRHLLPVEYGVENAAALRRSTARHIRSFELVVTVSETVKREIVELFGLSPDRILVAPNAVDRPDPAAPETTLPGLAEATPFFLMVNPGGGNKNWRQVLEAFALYARTPSAGSATRLVLAGSLSAEQERIARAIAADPVLASRVLCPGYVSDEQLRYLYRHARLAVFVPRYEGFGVPALEALAHEVPLVASDIPVLREVAGDAALFVALDDPEALADAFTRLSVDPALCSSLVVSGRARVDAFSWRVSANAVLDGLLAVAA